MKSLSVIIPVYNEVESLNQLHDELNSILSLIDNYEMIFVDDGSSDGSIDILKNLAETDDHTKVIQFYRNYGKAEALAEGFKVAEGDYVVTMDADLQDDPAEIPNLIKHLDEGFDIVSGWKKNRNDPLSKRLPSKLANFVTRMMTGVKIHDMNCGLKIYKQAVVKSLDIYGGRHRYIPALAGQKKFKVSEIVVNHRPRKFGVTKYGGSRLFHGFFDLLTILFLNRYIQRPLHLFGLFGLVGVGSALIIESTAIYYRLFLGHPFQKHFAMIVFGAMVFVLGMWFFSIGLIAEMITASQRGKEDRVKQIFDRSFE